MLSHIFPDFHPLSLSHPLFNWTENAKEGKPGGHLWFRFALNIALKK